MTATPAISRSDFDQAVRAHLYLIELTNELEYRLHAQAGDPAANDVQALQQAAGAVVAALRTHLFRQDQVVLPILETLARADG
jgi:hypothetical protein